MINIRLNGEKLSANTKFLLFQTLHSCAQSGLNFVSIVDGQLFAIARNIIAESALPITLSSGCYSIVLNCGDIVLRARAALSSFNSERSIYFKGLYCYSYSSPLVDYDLEILRYADTSTVPGRVRFLSFRIQNLAWVLGRFISGPRLVNRRRILFCSYRKSSDTLYSLARVPKSAVIRMNYPLDYFRHLTLGISKPSTDCFFVRDFFDVLAVLITPASKTERIFYYFSMPGSFLQRRVLRILNYRNKFIIHLAHGRISSSKFLNYTRFVISELYDRAYVERHLRLFVRRSSYLNIGYDQSGIIFYIHGYVKGSKYGVGKLVRDIYFILALRDRARNRRPTRTELVIKPHPTAQLLLFVLMLMPKSICRVYQASSYYRVSEIFCNSPTFEILLRDDRTVGKLHFFQGHWIGRLPSDD
jgi:hypothetical protein